MYSVNPYREIDISRIFHSNFPNSQTAYTALPLPPRQPSTEGGFPLVKSILFSMILTLPPPPPTIHSTLYYMYVEPLCTFQADFPAFVIQIFSDN